jgi:hypothetical protein
MNKYRGDYEYDVYKITYDVIKQLLQIHGDTVRSLYHDGCFIVIKLLLEQQNKNLLDAFAKKYLNEQALKYITSSIAINKIYKLNHESSVPT